MSIVSNAQLKTRFETGDVPTQQDFTDLIDTATTADYAVFTNLVGNVDSSPLEWGYITSGRWGDTSNSNTSFYIPSNVNLVEVGINLKIYLTEGPYNGYALAEVRKNGQTANIDGAGEGDFFNSIFINHPDVAVGQSGLNATFPPLPVTYGDEIAVVLSSTATSNIVAATEDTRHSFWIRRLA